MFAMNRTTDAATQTLPRAGAFFPEGDVIGHADATFWAPEWHAPLSRAGAVVNPEPRVTLLQACYASIQARTAAAVDPRLMWAHQLARNHGSFSQQAILDGLPWDEVRVLLPQLERASDLLDLFVQHVQRWPGANPSVSCFAIQPHEGRYGLVGVISPPKANACSQPATALLPLQ